MANVILPRSWHLPDRLVTSETAHSNRRRFMQQAGLAGAALAFAPMAGCSRAEEVTTGAASEPAGSVRYPAPRNKEFDPGWRLTNEKWAGSYNNFYEFSPKKGQVTHLARSLVTAPWPIQITGLVEKPMTLDAMELAELFTLEERVYRFRCVEAWAMVVPWTGFPLSKLLAKVTPRSEAKFLRFESFHRPEEAPGFKQLPDSPWPYSEGLRLDEATHPLTLMATGIYGKPLAKQHGAPMRLVVPWKYGYKNIKSIVKIELVENQPGTFWETLAPDEYPFESNVNPKVPHPRWSQATERMIDTGDRVRTKAYNGYGNSVAQLYGRT